MSRDQQDHSEHVEAFRNSEFFKQAARNPTIRIPLAVSHKGEGDDYPELNRAEDAGDRCILYDSDCDIIVHSPENARRIGEWLIEWANAKEARDE